jgi:hypothetical protein
MLTMCRFKEGKGGERRGSRGSRGRWSEGRV